MTKYLKIGVSGLLISFLGTLPLGTLNITAFNIAASKNVDAAVSFAIAVVLVELIVVWATLKGDNKINFDGKISLYLIPIGATLLLYLAIHSFIAMNNIAEISTTANMFPSIESPFLLGFLLSTLNPLHIPFWMGWNRILITKKIVQKTFSSYITYIMSIGAGSLGGLFIFIFAGSRIFQNYQEYNMTINLILGLLYLGFSFYLMFLLYKKHFKLKIQ